MLKEVSKLFSQKVKAATLILIGTLVWSWTMVKSGWIYSYGIGFWGANGHDGVWHIALAESLVKGSLSMPVFAGLELQNYHIGFDLILAALHKFTLIPVVNLYFQIIPPVLAILVGVLTYKFVYEWTKSSSASLWSVFFVYFGGSFGWLLGKGESAFWSQQAISSLINPPFALSTVLILSGLIILMKQDKKILDFLLCSLFFGVLIEIKAYAGILALGGLLVAGLYNLWHRRDTAILKVFIISLVVSLVIFLPLNKNSGSLLVWQPFWFLETMMGLSDRVGWDKFYSAMMTYKSGHIWIKEIPAYFVALVIFYVGNLGTRIIKEVLVWKWVRNLKSIEWVEIFFMSIIVAGVAIPTFFLQKGTPWNTIQFFYYSLFFSGILAGVTMSQIKNKFIIFGIVLITIPTTILTLKDVYIPSRPPAKLSNPELSALLFLKRLPTGVVLTYPFDPIAAKEAEKNPPRPLSLYTSTAYVSAFSAHPIFLEDEINLDITGYNWPERLMAIKSWYKEKDQTLAREFLRENGIKYVYWLKGQRALLGEGQLGIKNIFENSEVTVYQVETN